MDVSNKKGNSISEIEKFIERSFPEDETMSSPFPSSKYPYEFPPRHRIHICNFVQEVKKKCRLVVSISKSQDSNPPKSKRQKQNASNNTLAQPKPAEEDNDGLDIRSRKE